MYYQHQSLCIARLQGIREKKGILLQNKYPEYKYKQKIIINEYHHADH